MMRDMPRALRIRFRPIASSDAYTVAKWRNTESARQSFFSDAIVTPDTHEQFMQRRQPHDLVWVIELADAPIGMLSLAVDVDARTGEYGRAYLDTAYRGKGYWLETEWLLLSYAFDTLRLESVWLVIFADNVEMNAIHVRYGWLPANGEMPTVRGREIVKLTYGRAMWEERRAAMWRDVQQRVTCER